MCKTLQPYSIVFVKHDSSKCTCALMILSITSKIKDQTYAKKFLLPREKARLRASSLAVADAAAVAPPAAAAVPSALPDVATRSDEERAATRMSDVVY